MFMNKEINEIDLRKLDLNLLLVFSAMMRERSVAKASGRLYLGPSAVSMALSRLREALGDPLFVRAGTSMEPTPRAQALWHNIEPALVTIEGAIRPPTFDPGTTTQTFRFACPDDLELALVPRLMRRLDERAPLAQLALRPSDFRSMYPSLDAGDAHVALSALPAGRPDSRHHVEKLHTETFLAIYDRTQLDQTGKLNMRRFTETDHVLLSVRGDLNGPIDQTLAARGKSRRIRCAVSHFPTLPFILKERPAIACVPGTAARYFADTFDLECSPLPVTSPQFTLGLVWHARLDADPAQSWFRSLVIETLDEVLAPKADR